MWVVRHGGAVHEPTDRWGLRPLDYLLFHPTLHGPNAARLDTAGPDAADGDAVVAGDMTAAEEPPASMAEWHARTATASRGDKFTALFADGSAGACNKPWLQAFFPVHPSEVVEAMAIAAWRRRGRGVVWWHMQVRMWMW